MVQENKDIPKDEEEEIFKTLGHKIRREIIKTIGTGEKLTFTEIQQSLGKIDSPALSYHLKFLHPLIEQKNGAYLLNKIGLAAFNLLSKTDQSVKFSKYKKYFTHAHIITILCWAIASLLVPFTISYTEDKLLSIILINIIIGITSAINETAIGFLRHRY
jgi:DNA-binding transcriptional ArsR family regulator